MIRLRWYYQSEISKGIMTKRLSVIIFFALLLYSCDFTPLSVFSKQKMAEVVIDVHKAEYTMRYMSRNIKDVERKEYINSVFEKHGVTKEEFDESVAWYAMNPDAYVDVYEIVVDSLEGLKLLVEDYYFHPEEIPTYLDSLDTVNIWQRGSEIYYERPRLARNRAKLLNSKIAEMQFEYTDTAYFAEEDVYRINYMIRLYDRDSAVHYNTEFRVYRTDSIVDTVGTCVLSDSILRRYKMTVRVPDSVRAIRIEGYLLDTLGEEALFEIDSIGFYKVYNPYRYPMSGGTLSEINDKVDSVARSERKVKAGFTKTVRNSNFTPLLGKDLEIKK